MTPAVRWKGLDLRQRVLADGGIEHKQHGMRRSVIHLADHTHDLFELVHQLGLVLQPAGGVDQKHVDILLLRRRQRVEGKARRIRALRACDHGRLRPLAPHLELLDRRSAKRVAGGQHHLAAFGGEFLREFSDGGGLARAVDPDHEDHERLPGRIDLERLCHRRQHLLDLGGDDVLDLVRRDRLVVASSADGVRDPHRD
ncbi:hypothetical protein ABH987_001535 [Bradyrhizobium ottawaense]